MSVLTNEEVKKALGIDLDLTFHGSELKDARAIEAAVMEKLKRQEPVAYATEDGERVVTAITYAMAKRDGGAFRRYVLRPFSVPLYAAPVPAAVPDKEALIDLINEHLGDALFCTRAWSAWQVGTMSERDFESVGESDGPADLADAILSRLSSPQPAAVPDGLIEKIKEYGDAKVAWGISYGMDVPEKDRSPEILAEIEALLSAAPSAPAVPDDVVKDAERYRALRRVLIVEDAISEAMAKAMEDHAEKIESFVPPKESDFDAVADAALAAAIDAAMQKGGE